MDDKIKLLVAALRKAGLTIPERCRTIDDVILAVEAQGPEATDDDDDDMGMDFGEDGIPADTAPAGGAPMLMSDGRGKPKPAKLEKARAGVAAALGMPLR